MKNYAIYNNKDELLFSGNTKECADYLGITINGFTCKLKRQNRNPEKYKNPKKYTTKIVFIPKNEKFYTKVNYTFLCTKTFIVNVYRNHDIKFLKGNRYQAKIDYKTKYIEIFTDEYKLEFSVHDEMYKKIAPNFKCRKGW